MNRPMLRRLALSLLVMGMATVIRPARANDNSPVLVEGVVPDEATRAAFIARQPIGRIGAPEEIADLVVYLAGATYTSGQAYAIDGGWTI